MTKRVLITRVAVGTTCEIDIYKRVRDYSKKTGIPISKITDRAYEEYLALHDTKKE